MQKDNRKQDNSRQRVWEQSEKVTEERRRVKWDKAEKETKDQGQGNRVAKQGQEPGLHKLQDKE